ncbi:MAG: electron transfer flavoprotein subunit alpha/FixB family protein [Clostridia bacterium]|nr:electron transfer flavoprotein subunit alpha/FixB family protein [Clostridia bacterium]
MNNNDEMTAKCECGCKKTIFVYCEQRDGVLSKVSFELLGVASELASQSDQKVCAMLIGSNLKGLPEELIQYGADSVYVCDDKRLAHYLTEPYAQATGNIIRDFKPNIVLFPATSIGRDLAPRLSARLRTGLTADCTKLEVDADGNLFMTRPAFGGNLFATIICPDHRPQMSTVRPGVMQMKQKDDNRKGEIINVNVTFDESKFNVELVEEIKEKASEDNIENAKILVSVGRGMQTQIDEARHLAKCLNATLSCSRAVVDGGVLPQDRQVGQTGKTVRPLCYLALGISGAVQHLAGMSDSEYLIAVNKDKDATIFNVAHLGIVGDAKAILPYLEKEIENLKNA